MARRRVVRATRACSDGTRSTHNGMVTDAKCSSAFLDVAGGGPVERTAAMVRVSRSISQLCLMFDDRVCDGEDSAGFLRFVADAIESPLSVLADL